MEMKNSTTATNSKLHHEQLLHARLKMQGDSAHHLEEICCEDGITWLNHSMATTIDMTWFALRDVPSPVVLIIGGVDRAEDQHKLKMLVKEKVHAVVCMGSTPWKYFNAYRDCTELIVRARDLEEAVDIAKSLATKKAKTILFSPSCPSYDAFDNYKNRGNAFRKIVQEKINPIKNKTKNKK
jgi:UDP-N-acetylmuramoylalanine--D-glutamate ligase